ncbi:MAG: hypothetical protein FWE36_08205 [Erysipelotrichales bacterium]|nr:hypothetical protein [Erysipelotrichales bacterium]
MDKQLTIKDQVPWSIMTVKEYFYQMFDMKEAIMSSPVKSFESPNGEIEVLVFKSDHVEDFKGSYFDDELDLDENKNKELFEDFKKKADFYFCAKWKKNDYDTIEIPDEIYLSVDAAKDGLKRLFHQKS